MLLVGIQVDLIDRVVHQTIFINGHLVSLKYEDYVIIHKNRSSNLLEDGKYDGVV